MTLAAALATYRQAFADLSLDRPLTPNEAIVLLVVRDEIARSLAEPQNRPSLSQRWELARLDRQLMGWGDRILAVIDVVGIGKQRRADPVAWWWRLAPGRRLWTWLDPLAQVGSAIALTGSAGLVLDISAKFLVPGVDWLGSLAVVGQSAIILFAGGSLVTQTGQTWLKCLAIRCGIRDRYWHEVGFVGSIALTLTLIVIRVTSFPAVSRTYLNWGEGAFYRGEFSTAADNFNRSLTFDPENRRARYLLGRVYDELEDRDKAREQYAQAIQNQPNAEDPLSDDRATYLQAANNLARLWILKNEPAIAASTLRKAEPLLPEAARLPEEPLPAAQQPYRLFAYTMNKNLGWAYLAQKRYPESRDKLAFALELARSLSREDQGAAAQCLLAQALEGLKDSQSQKEAIAAWQVCSQFAWMQENTAEEEAWLGLAGERLQRLEKK